MLSNHIFVEAVETSIYPTARKLEEECRALFNKQFVPGMGPTGVRGSNELAFTIGYLEASIAILKRLAKEQGIELPE